MKKYFLTSVLLVVLMSITGCGIMEAKDMKTTVNISQKINLVRDNNTNVMILLM